jgi:hypothetical protein
MLAAVHTAKRLRASADVPKRPRIVIENAETGLAVSAVPGRRDGEMDVEVRPPRPIKPVDTVIPAAGRVGRSLALKVSNPYLLFDAGKLGISPSEMLSLHGAPDARLLTCLGAEADEVRSHLGLAPESDLPKLALLLSDEGRILARTIYLDQWHPGLPLTGLVTFIVAILVPGSPWHDAARDGSEFRFRGPRETIRVGASRDDSSGDVTSVKIADRRVINHVENISI